MAWLLPSDVYHSSLTGQPFYKYTMRYLEIISETPISNMSYIGDMDTAGTFRDDDLKKFRSPEWNERVIRLFQNSPWDWEIHVVNGNEDKRVKLTTKHFIDWIDTRHARDYVGIHSKAWAEKIVNHPLDTEGKINILLLQNEGSERVGLTPWMVAHRIGHCFFESNDRFENEHIQNLTQQVLMSLVALYNTIVKFHQDSGRSTVDFNKIASLLSNFRSARMGNLRNSGEYGVELMAEFILNGRVILKKDWIGGNPRPQYQVSPVEDAILKASVVVGSISRALKWEKPFEMLYREMSGNPLRPRTRAAFRAILIDMEERGVEDTFNRENFPSKLWSDNEIMHRDIQNTEDYINETLGKIITLCIGQVLVL